MRKFTYLITNERGIHARPAAFLTSEVRKFPRTYVTIKKGDETADAANMSDLMNLDVWPGDTVTVIIEGDDEENAARDIREFFEKHL